MKLYYICINYIIIGEGMGVRGGRRGVGWGVGVEVEVEVWLKNNIHIYNCRFYYLKLTNLLYFK